MRAHALRLVPSLGLLLLACSDALEPVPFQGISGTVTFVGQPPPNTEWVRVAVYETVPQNELEFLDLVAFSDTVRLTGDSARYVVSLNPGLYAWVAAFWKPEDQPLTALLVAGWFTRAGGAFGAPAAALVEADAESGDIDIIVDFDNLLDVGETLELLP